jgi:hypothetical protein
MITKLPGSGFENPAGLKCTHNFFTQIHGNAGLALTGMLQTSVFKKFILFVNRLNHCLLRRQALYLELRYTFSQDHEY